jgi:hypothetical protein
MTCPAHGLCPICDEGYVEPCPCCNGNNWIHEIDCPIDVPDIDDEKAIACFTAHFGEIEQ